MIFPWKTFAMRTPYLFVAVFLLSASVCAVGKETEESPDEFSAKAFWASLAVFLAAFSYAHRVGISVEIRAWRSLGFFPWIPVVDAMICLVLSTLVSAPISRDAFAISVEFYAHLWRFCAEVCFLIAGFIGGSMVYMVIVYTSLFMMIAFGILLCI